MANGKFAGGDGSKENPYLIEDAFDLDAIRNNCSANYKLIKDINLDVKPFNEGEGWKTIENFKGKLNGNGYIIKNLYMNSSSPYSGFFYSLEATSDIQNIQLQNINIIINKGYKIGILASSANGNIENCCVKNGNLTAKIGEFVAPLIGVAEASCKVTNCYTSDINILILHSDATNHISNFIGYVSYATIRNCYSNCKVNIKKGLIGECYNGFVNDSYWDVETSEQINSEGGMGKTTKEMKTPSTYINWDTEKTNDGKPIWILKEGQYPRLWFETEPQKYLIKQNNNYYSLKSSLRQLGQPKDNEELVKWYKEDGIDDLNVLCTNKELIPQIKKEISGKIQIAKWEEK